MNERVEFIYRSRWWAFSTKLLDWETIGYVEWDEYCQRVLRQRINDGILDDAPIFGDIDAFISKGYAETYKGMVDVITAGFPCQGWSAIGKQKGEDDKRNKWPQTREAIRIIRPRYIQLENSTNIMSKGFIFQIIEDLSALGYVGRATRLSGLHVGAHSKRERMWVKAELPDSACRRLEGWNDIIEKWETKTRSISPLGEIDVRLDLPDPGAFRADNVVARRVDRLKAIGNGQIPQVVAAAWRLFAD